MGSAVVLVALAAVVLILGLTIWSGHDDKNNDPTLAPQPTRVPAQKAPAKLALNSHEYIKVFLFVEEVFVLFSLDSPTDEDTAQVKRIVRAMEGGEFRVIETFEIEKRSFASESLFHAKTLVGMGNRVVVHHAILENKGGGDLKVTMSALAAYSPDGGFKESFLREPSFAVFKPAAGTRDINRRLLV